jgi:hypothetical protein
MSPARDVEKVRLDWGFAIDAQMGVPLKLLQTRAFYVSANGDIEFDETTKEIVL